MKKRTCSVSNTRAREILDKIPETPPRYGTFYQVPRFLVAFAVFDQSFPFRLRVECSECLAGIRGASSPSLSANTGGGVDVVIKPCNIVRSRAFEAFKDNTPSYCYTKPRSDVV